MKKNLVFSYLLCMLLPVMTLATSGYYVKQNGDTIRGNFSNVAENGNPLTVDFMPSNSSTLLTLKPEDVRCMRIGNLEYFVSYNGPVTKTTDGTNTTENMHLFLRQITESNGYSFYTYNDQQPILFYSGSDNKIVELKRHEAAPNETDDYHGQLRNLFATKIDSADLTSMLHKVDYTEESLISFIDDVNDLTSVHASVPAMKGIIISAGYIYNSFVVDGNNELPQVATDYEGSGSWMAAVGYIKPLKKAGGRYFIYPNIQAFSYKTTGVTNDTDGVVKSGFSSDLVLFPQFSIGFNFIHKPAIKMFASVGFGAMIFMDNTETYDKDFTAGNSVHASNSDNDVAFDLNISVGGALFNRYILFVGYDVPAAASNNQYYTGYLAGVEVGLGIRL
jgi:hypothetical protein